MNVAVALKAKKTELRSKKSEKKIKLQKVVSKKRSRLFAKPAVVIASREESEAAADSVMRKHGAEILKAWTQK